MSDISLPHLGKFITYEEVTGERVHFADATHLLSQLNLHGVLPIIAMLNNCFVRASVNKVEMRNLQVGLVERLFDDNLKQKLSASDFGHDIDVVVFHRRQLLLMLRLALMSCPAKGGKQWDVEAQHIFARACLMVNDCAGSREGELPPEATWLDHALMMIPVIELSLDEETCGLVGRSYQLWLDIPNSSEMQTEKDYVPIAQRFLDHYNISLESFIHGLYFLLAKLETFDPASVNPMEALVVNANVIASDCAYLHETFERVLSIVACTLSTLRDKVITEPVQSTRYDLTLLGRYPFVEVEPKVFVCFDRGFHRRFFTDGIYWLIFNLLSAEEQKGFQSFFGKVFAVYIERLLKFGYNTVARSTRLYCKFEFSETNAEVCDVFVEGKDAWVIVETKGSLLTTRAKYGSDAEDLERDLRAKFIAFQSGKNKGIGQLANTIIKLLGGACIKSQQLQVQNIRWIYPVLVSYDPTVASSFITMFFQDEFKTALGERPSKPRVFPPIVLGAEDLEAYAALGPKHELQHVLAAYRQRGLPVENVARFIHRWYSKQTQLL